MKQTLPVNKNDYIDVEFKDLTHEGAGVAKVDGYPLFVPNALPGEKAKIKVVKANKGYGFARLIETYEESPYRVKPLCPIYKECGGCQLQHLSYEGQLLAKEKQVREVLTRIGKLEDVKVHPTLGMQDPWRYRNKSQVPIGEHEGGLIGGFYQQRTHQIIDMKACLIQQEKNDEVIQKVKEICSRHGVRAYDEGRHKGDLRHIMARYGLVTGEVMIVLVTRTKDLSNKNKVIEEITAEISGVKSIVHNINSKKTNVIMGEETRVLWGEEVIYDYIGAIKFAISARSFYQVNPDQTKVLYEKALEYANLTGEEEVIDAYCGIGTISLFLAQKAKKVFGVEIVPEAIEDAKRNADLNDIRNADFAVGKAEEVIPKWYEQGNSADVLVVDPPRKGCDEALLQTIIDMKPKKVVYVSCNPGTLARDLRVLEDGGYKTVEVQPVDMFPQTVHCEAVAWLELV
ncbi:23S rRNA (uracil1939-C5)-methyltransferase [Cytobacillus horneckiae]|uniref:23S rRNA (Uracil(1939)-C(5))-methyltransferase RlmD n=1 Tax=Cytobacillus horneckiae TaxID=549687 RepID=A0A2N0ZG91_9BACI|nr:23S rRNA (uracil(1939)-C(5))-methyltransferase RlmD [Cytobacillus horneckiae]MBN6886084.1 23S rRNA (uracil(1939)-C(5))-methyltransferase RlmD [Cytobacillus horneckiae]MEC1155778.1 23S rRNA (uracil(1939)-C(5))-methyltransferase RlmD [Cytobacillus horneckiae]MED2939317.1 23S rRNA (uracil(1939)-C(5))-methyltransferase RlmD [Cytobacillus horneckiae]PKG28542.1 23S rRNA (uracil(1939)-C(5))-methyltransferase RlmD [Cytobacillus horneckiae]